MKLLMIIKKMINFTKFCNKIVKFIQYNGCSLTFFFFFFTNCSNDEELLEKISFFIKHCLDNKDVVELLFCLYEKKKFIFRQYILEKKCTMIIV